MLKKDRCIQEKLQPSEAVHAYGGNPEYYQNLLVRLLDVLEFLEWYVKREEREDRIYWNGSEYLEVDKLVAWILNRFREHGMDSVVFEAVIKRDVQTMRTNNKEQCKGRKFAQYIRSVKSWILLYVKHNRIVTIDEKYKELFGGKMEADFQCSVPETNKDALKWLYDNTGDYDTGKFVKCKEDD